MMVWALQVVLAGAPALPPALVDAIRAGERHSHSYAIARDDLISHQAQQTAALDGLLPSVALSGSYTRNQYATQVQLPQGPGQPANLVTMTPLDQLGATAALNVPLVNPAALSRYAEARHASAASERATEASNHDIQLDVAQAYFQVVGAQGVAAAADRATRTAEVNQAVVEARVGAGTANALSLDKARVDTARARRTRADAERTLAPARRRLGTLTGQPEPQVLPDPGVPVPPAEPEERFVGQALERRPELAQAREALEQARAQHRTAWAGALPAATGNAVEHFTNATGFLGKSAYWSAGVTLSWNIDPVVSWETVRQAEAAAATSQERLEQMLEDVRDQVHTSWLDVVAGKARLDQSVAEAVSATEALELASLRNREGTALVLEVSQAEADAFNAEATLSQTRADLAYSILALHRAAGERLVEE